MGRKNDGVNSSMRGFAELKKIKWSFSFLAFCTLSHYWANMHFSNVPMQLFMPDGSIGHTSRLILPSLITAVCLFILYLMTKKQVDASFSDEQQRRLLASAALAGSIAMGLDMALPERMSFFVVSYIAFALYYFATISCFVSRGARMGLFAAFSYLFFSTFLASAIDLAIRATPLIPSASVYLIAPIASWAALHIYDRRTRNLLDSDSPAHIPASPEENQPGLPSQLFFIMLIAGIIAGIDFYQAFDVHAAFQESYASLISFAVLLGTALTYLVVIAKSMSLEFLIHRIGFPLIIASLVLSFLPENGNLEAVFSSFSLIGTQLIVSLAWIICIFFHSKLKLPVDRICIQLFLPIFVGRTIGIGLSGLSGIAFSSADAKVVLTLLAISLVYASTFLYGSKPRKNKQSQKNESRAMISWRYASIAPASDSIESLESTARKIGAATRMTPRELDVFLLMANGRNRKYIAEKLFISENTAKKHVTKVYEKLGVHSQQELLDIVEKERGESIH